MVSKSTPPPQTYLSDSFLEMVGCMYDAPLDARQHLDMKMAFMAGALTAMNGKKGRNVLMQELAAFNMFIKKESVKAAMAEASTHPPKE